MLLDALLASIVVFAIIGTVLALAIFYVAATHAVLFSVLLYPGFLYPRLFLSNYAEIVAYKAGDIVRISCLTL